MRIGYGVCVGSWDKLQRWVLPHTAGRPLVALAGQTAITAAYNTILDAYQDADLDALILQHDDLELVDPAGEGKLVDAVLDPAVALAGVAGGGSDAGLAWWNQTPIGHQQTDAMVIDFGQRAGDVQALEGSVLTFGRWAIGNLRFDERFPGFHGYDVDICRTAWNLGKRVVVVDVDTWHHNSMGFKSEDSHGEWLECDRVHRGKQGLV